MQFFKLTPKSYPPTQHSIQPPLSETLFLIIQPQPKWFFDYASRVVPKTYNILHFGGVCMPCPAE